jgi:hypothetical protein
MSRGLCDGLAHKGRVLDRLLEEDVKPLGHSMHHLHRAQIPSSLWELGRTIANIPRLRPELSYSYGVALSSDVLKAPHLGLLVHLIAGPHSNSEVCATVHASLRARGFQGEGPGGQD